MQFLQIVPSEFVSNVSTFVDLRTVTQLKTTCRLGWTAAKETYHRYTDLHNKQLEAAEMRENRKARRLASYGYPMPYCGHLYNLANARYDVLRYLQAQRVVVNIPKKLCVRERRRGKHWTCGYYGFP